MAGIDKEKMDERARRLTKVATKAHILNAWGPIGGGTDDDTVSVRSAVSTRSDRRRNMEQDDDNNSVKSDRRSIRGYDNDITSVKSEQFAERARNGYMTNELDDLKAASREAEFAAERSARRLEEERAKLRQKEKEAAELESKLEQLQEDNNRSQLELYRAQKDAETAQAKLKDLDKFKERVEEDHEKEIEKMKRKLEREFSDQLERRSELLRAEQEEKDQSARHRIHKGDNIPLLVGGRQFLEPRTTFDNLPNKFKRMISGNEKYNIENGSIRIDRNPKYFPAILSFLRDGEKCSILPESEQELKELLEEAYFYEIPDLVKLANEMIVLSSKELGSVIHKKDLDQANRFIGSSHKPVVHLSINLKPFKKEFMSTAAMDHVELFFKISESLKRHFNFLCAPDLKNPGLFWNFYDQGNLTHSLSFVDRTQDRENLKVFSPSEGARSLGETRTIPEVFLAKFLTMNLSQSDQTRLVDLQFWRDLLDCDIHT